MSDAAQTRNLLSARAELLGDETVFQVAAEAYAAAAAGQKVYPFHLGNVGHPHTAEHRRRHEQGDPRRQDRVLVCRAGIPELREADRRRRRPCSRPQVRSGERHHPARRQAGHRQVPPRPDGPRRRGPLSQPGLPDLLVADRHLRRHGRCRTPTARRATRLRARPRRPRTRHHPAHAAAHTQRLPQPDWCGVSPSRSCERLAELVLEHDLYVLCDEAYFDIRLDGGASRSLASLPGMQERCVILYTFAKKYAMGGWRLGASIASRRPITDVFIKLNTNLESCTNHFAQYAAVEALTGDQSGARRILHAERAARRRRAAYSTPRRASPASSRTRRSTSTPMSPAP